MDRVIAHTVDVETAPERAQLANAGGDRRVQIRTTERAHHQVRLPHARRDALAHHLQQPVSRVVAQRVVHVLEPVKVQVQHRCHRPRPLRPRDRSISPSPYPSIPNSAGFTNLTTPSGSTTATPSDIVSMNSRAANAGVISTRR